MLRLAVLLIVILSGCAVVETEAPGNTQRLLDGSAIGLDAIEPASTDILATTSEMRAWVKQKTRGSTSARSRLRRLVQGMIDDGLLSLEYDENLTHTAIETFQKHQGNCLSFSLLFVALAREANLDVTFQMVDIPPSFNSDGELVTLNNHINVLVRRIRSDTQFHMNHVVDFNTAEYNGNYETRTVNDTYAIALYHSNIGVELLQLGDTVNAFRHLRHAILLNSDIPGFWTNLGYLYSSIDKKELAIDAYRQALSIKPSYKSALVNLAGVHAALGNLEQANYYLERAQAYREINPYFHLQKARDLFLDAAYDQALAAVNRAIDLKEDEHQFFFLKGLIENQLNLGPEAEKSYLRAIEIAHKPEIAAGYRRKLDRLGDNDLL